jgi:hypothetical protein
LPNWKKGWKDGREGRRKGGSRKWKKREHAPEVNFLSNVNTCLYRHGYTESMRNYGFRSILAA